MGLPKVVEDATSFNSPEQCLQAPGSSAGQRNVLFQSE